MPSAPTDRCFAAVKASAWASAAVASSIKHNGKMDAGSSAGVSTTTAPIRADPADKESNDLYAAITHYKRKIDLTEQADTVLEVLMQLSMAGVSWQRGGRWDWPRHAAESSIPQLGTRGIVIPIARYAVVEVAFLVQRLRNMSCKLPIALVHSDNDRLSDHDITRAVAGATGVRAINLDSFATSWCGRRINVPLRGYQIKPVALLVAPFDEVLILDADNTPLVDPTPLFETPSYLEHGNLFWSDFFQRGAPFTLRLGLGLPPEPAEGMYDIESGQVLFNRRALKEALGPLGCLAAVSYDRGNQVKKSLPLLLCTCVELWESA